RRNHLCGAWLRRREKTASEETGGTPTTLLCTTQYKRRHFRAAKDADFFQETDAPAHVEISGGEFELSLLKLAILDVEDDGPHARNAHLTAVGVAGEGPLRAVAVKLHRGVRIMGEGDDRFVQRHAGKGHLRAETAAPEVFQSNEPETASRQLKGSSAI